MIATGSNRNHGYLHSFGAEPVTYGPGLVERVRELGEVTAVFDAAGNPESVVATVELLRDRRRAVTALGNQYAYAAGTAGVHQAPQRVAAVLKLTEDGKLIFEIERMPLTQARRTLERSAAGHVRGKIVLVP